MVADGDSSNSTVSPLWTISGCPRGPSLWHQTRNVGEVPVALYASGPSETRLGHCAAHYLVMDEEFPRKDGGLVRKSEPP